MSANSFLDVVLILNFFIIPVIIIFSPKKKACREYDRRLINILKYYKQIAGSLTKKSEKHLTTNANLYNLLSFFYFVQVQK